MRYRWLFGVLLFCIIGTAFADPARIDPSSFGTSAKFSVDNNDMSLSTAVATIEARRGAPGYSWIRIHFYSFPLTAEDVVAVTNGNIESMEKRWRELYKPNMPNEYKKNAVIQLSVDDKFQVGQVDMSVPGHACTIAPFEPDVKKFLQSYQYDGKNLKLKSKGSYVCDMKFMGIPNQKFSWDINLNVPVFRRRS
jgi:hypothetical protein